MEYAHPRPWHAGSLFVAGPRRPLSFGDRCLWLGKLGNALQAQQISGKEYLAGRALLSFIGDDGRVDPSHAAIASRACCSERTVRRALARFDALGLLRWQRRLVRQPGAWRSEQASNAYELVPDGRPITPRMPATRKLLRLHCGGQVGREGSFVRIIEASAPPISDPGHDLLAARRAVMEVRWRQAPAGRPSDREAVRNGHRLYGMGILPKVRTRFPKIRAFLPSAQAARTDEMSRVGATLALSRQMACVQDAGKTHFLRMAKTHTFAVTGPIWSGSPYPGLRPFTTEEVAIFFGHGREVDALVARLRDPAQRFLAVVGASGTGKSSLVRAGLLPRLADGAIEGSRHWRVLTFTPGAVSDDPLTALAVELGDMLPSTRKQKPAEIAKALAALPQHLSRYAEEILAAQPVGAVLVLFVDQFEELFTLATEDRRRSFIEFLVQAIGDPRLRVFVTLRADFLSQCAAEP